MIGVLASIRPDSWNFPLFLHVAGAAVFFGALTVGAVAQLTATKVAEPQLLQRVAFRTLLIVGLPAYIIFRVGAEWIYEKEFPDVAWDKYALDYKEYASLTEVHRTPEIRKTVEAFRKSDADPRSRDFIVTARSSDDIPAGLDDYLKDRGADANGVFAVNAPGQAKALNIGGDVTGLNITSILVAFIGAVILLAVLRLVRGASI